MRKLGRATDQRNALLKNQVSDLLWNGKLQTTYARAKEVQKLAEKCITLAVNSYEDTFTKTVTRVEKGKEVKKEIVNDGAKKLAARRQISARVNDLQEAKGQKESRTAYRMRTGDVKHPLMEKIFNVYAPKYDQRAKELGQKGGYTSIHKLGPRQGDAAEMAIIELL